TGVSSFLQGDYAQALKPFLRVLEVDPWADRARAFAVACSCETKGTNTAEGLLKGFKQPDARWARWATAFVELRSGSVSNATAHYTGVRICGRHRGTVKGPGVGMLPRNSVMNGIFYFGAS